MKACIQATGQRLQVIVALQPVFQGHGCFGGFHFCAPKFFFIAGFFNTCITVEVTKPRIQQEERAENVV